MENKHTKEYAENIAHDYEVNEGYYSKEWSNGFSKGYMTSIKVNKVPEILESLITLQKRLELLILQTPSGKERNKMTDENMVALSLINELS